MKHCLLLNLLFFLYQICCFCQTNPDVKIGLQTWQSKNLAVAVFRNGDKIFEAKTHEEWENAVRNKQPAWCYYNFDVENGNKHGKLYNMYAVIDERGLAPIGYHIPSKKEWENLERFIGANNAGKKLKSTHGWIDSKRWIPGKVKCNNCADWSAEFRRKIACNVCKDHETVQSNFAKQVLFSGNGINSFNFSGLPSGQRKFDEFKGQGNWSIWWCLTDLYNEVEYFELNADYEELGRGNYSLYKPTYYGNSVRCIKDIGNVPSSTKKILQNTNEFDVSQQFNKVSIESEHSNIPAINPNRAYNSQINVSISGWPSCVQNSRQKIIFVIVDKNDIPVTYFKELAGADNYLAKNETKGYQVKKEACIFHYEDCDLDLQGPFSCEMYLRKNGTFVSSGDYKVGKWKCNVRDRVQYYDMKLD